MRILPQIFAAMFTAAFALSALPAYADQADKDACVGLADGDACKRAGGQAAVCIPDESNPNALTCDDSGAGRSSGGSGCSASGGAADPLTMTLLGLPALVWSRRKQGNDRGRAERRGS
jgi:hypothetical protein